MAAHGDDRIHIHSLSPGDVALLKDIAEAAADKAVAKAFTSMGLDGSNPLASQQLFGSLRALVDRMGDEDHVADRTWVRRTRLRSEGAFGKLIVSIIGLAVIGAANAIWTGVRAMLPPAPPH